MTPRQHTRAGSDLTTSLAAGLAGAAVLTAVHETTRRITPRAPRMDVLGERAIAKAWRGAGGTPPRGRTLHRLALGGDLVANSAYYGLSGRVANVIADFEIVPRWSTITCTDVCRLLTKHTCPSVPIGAAATFGSTVPGAKLTFDAAGGLVTSDDTN